MIIGPFHAFNLIRSGKTSSYEFSDRKGVVSTPRFSYQEWLNVVTRTVSEVGRDRVCLKLIPYDIGDKMRIWKRLLWRF